MSQDRYFVIDTEGSNPWSLYDHDEGFTTHFHALNEPKARAEARAVGIEGDTPAFVSVEATVSRDGRFDESAQFLSLAQAKGLRLQLDAAIAEIEAAGEEAA